MRVGERQITRHARRLEGVRTPPQQRQARCDHVVARLGADDRALADESVDVETMRCSVGRQIGRERAGGIHAWGCSLPRPLPVQTGLLTEVPTEIRHDVGGPDPPLLRGGELALAPPERVVEGARVSGRGRPDRVEVVVVRSVQRDGVLRRWVAGLPVPGVVEEVHPLQIEHVPVAVGQHHRERHPVHGLAVEVHRRDRQDRVDAERVGALTVHDHVPHHALAAAGVTHRADRGHVDLPHEPVVERLAARRRPCLPEVEMLLEQLAALAHAGVGELIAEHVDAVRAHRDDDVPEAREAGGGVVVSLVVRERLPPLAAGPAVSGAFASVAR